MDGVCGYQFNLILPLAIITGGRLLEVCLQSLIRGPCSWEGEMGQL